mmetsp:Transcript_15113/g.37792  ORF Transcript_15113/g.37792 Transcript_15113/m.37792 type:complete len:276 (+) Transcript_15113:305-1132(+)
MEENLVHSVPLRPAASRRAAVHNRRGEKDSTERLGFVRYTHSSNQKMSCSAADLPLRTIQRGHFPWGNVTSRGGRGLCICASFSCAPSASGRSLARRASGSARTCTSEVRFFTYTCAKPFFLRMAASSTVGTAMIDASENWEASMADWNRSGSMKNLRWSYAGRGAIWCVAATDACARAVTARVWWRPCFSSCAIRCPRTSSALNLRGSAGIHVHMAPARVSMPRMSLGSSGGYNSARAAGMGSLRAAGDSAGSSSPVRARLWGECGGCGSIQTR